MKKKLHKLLLAFFVLSVATTANAQRNISTIAGTGTSGFSGDAAAATAAKINSPAGVAIDDSGRIYIVDRGNARIRRISKTGTITTIAGTGTAGYNGDNIAGSAAQINATGVAVDKAGNTFIADKGNNCVRKLSASGIITTVAGDTTMGFSGDNGPASMARLSGPSAVALDGAGNLYIADQGNNRIRVVSSGMITSVAGGGTGGMGDGGAATAGTLSIPTGVALDTAGNIFIIDQGNNRVRKVNKMGMISTYAGTGGIGWTGDGGAAIAATFNYPIGIAVDDSNNVYVAEGNNNVIRKIDAVGNIYTIAGTNVVGYSGDGGPATAAQLDNPTGVAVDTSGKVYVADLGNNRIRKIAWVSHAGIALTTATISNISVSPNPNMGVFSVSGSVNSLNSEQVGLEVTDMLGRVIYSTTTRSLNGLINAPLTLNNIPQGVYLLQVRAGAETSVVRFAINK